MMEGTRFAAPEPTAGMSMGTAQVASAGISAMAGIVPQVFMARSARRREKDLRKEAENEQKRALASDFLSSIGLLAKDAFVTQVAHEKQMKLVKGFNARLAAAKPVPARK